MEGTACSEGDPMNEILALAIWLILLALAFPYVRRTKHPQVKPLAAFLLFAMLFSVVSGTLFFALSWLVLKMGWAPGLANPVWALAFLALVFAPAVLFARWMIRRPPLDRPAPK
jgi:hypothetical protein